MLDAIKQFLARQWDDAPTAVASEGDLQLATVALLVELTRVDNEVSPLEREAVLQALQSKFALDAPASVALLQYAEARPEALNSYYEFTSQLNKGFDYSQKLKIIEKMWEVAFADGEVDKYEDHLIRKIAGLLYISHPDFIAAKHRVEAARQRSRHGNPSPA